MVVNDARYVDEHLNDLGLTIITKNKREGATKNYHIAGACTALTKQFRDIILPFPVENCPAHDVYIHRWVYLFGKKVVIEEPLQSWRIHVASASDTEISTPRVVSSISRYLKFKNVDTTKAFKLAANEFRELIRILNGRRDIFAEHYGLNELELAKIRINKIINAYEQRAELSGVSKLLRLSIITKMILNGHYKQFGVKSFVKDIINTFNK